VRAVWVLIVVALLWAGCQQPERPGLALRKHLLDVLGAELEKSPAEQDQAFMQSLMAALQEETEEAGPPLPPGPRVEEIQFSFDTRPRDLDEDGTSDVIDVTVWPKDSSGDTVKAVGTMHFALRRHSPIPGTRGEVLQSWFVGPESVNHAWKDAWVLDGHHFVLELTEESQEARRVVLEVNYIAPDGEELTAEPRRLKLQ